MLPRGVRSFYGPRTLLNIARGGGGRAGRWGDLSQPWFAAVLEEVPPCISELLGGLALLPPVPMHMFSHLPALYVTQSTISRFYHPGMSVLYLYLNFMRAESMLSNPPIRYVIVKQK